MAQIYIHSPFLSETEGKADRLLISSTRALFLLLLLQVQVHSQSDPKDISFILPPSSILEPYARESFPRLRYVTCVVHVKRHVRMYVCTYGACH
jgi:hypothetical protein